MFYVYSGYASPDNCDASEHPTYTLREFETEAEVIQFYETFTEDLHEECKNRIFIVIEGKRREIKRGLVLSEWDID